MIYFNTLLFHLIKIETKKFDVWSKQILRNNVQQLILQKNIFKSQDHRCIAKILAQTSDISINSHQSFPRSTLGLGKDCRNVYGKYEPSRSGILSKFRVNPALIVLGRQSIRMWQTTHASHVTVTPSTWRILDQVGVEQCDVARIAGPLTLSCCFGGAAWEASLILSILRLFLAPLLPQLHPRC